MNAVDFRCAIKDAAEWATRSEPADVGFRARCFVAVLAGMVGRDEPALRELLRELLGLTAEDDPTAQSKAP